MKDSKTNTNEINSPLISIVVPVYNIELFLDECINSILNQTYTDFELLLVNDGSTDSSPQICNKYVNLDSRIKVFNRTNGGLSAARNTGIENSSGEYICFIDGDDIIHPQYCEVLLQGILRNKNCTYCACSTKNFSDEPPEFEAFDINAVDYNRLRWDNYIKSAQMGVWNKIFKKDVFEDISFKEGKVFEDIIFSADLAPLVSKEILSTDCILYFGRIRKNSILSSQSNSITFNPDRIYAARYLIQKFKSISPDLYEFALSHAIGQPWSYVDLIYVKFAIKRNRSFLKAMQKLIKDYRIDFMNLSTISDIYKSRMKLFSRSIFLYRINAYMRLFRVLFCRFIRIDPYKSKHCI